MAKYQKFTSKSWADIMDEEDAKYGFLDDIVRDVMASPSVQSIITEQSRALLTTVEEEVDTWLEGVVSTGLWMEEDSVTAGGQAKRDGIEDRYASLTSVLAPPSSTESSIPSSKSSPAHSPASSIPSSPRRPSDQPHEVQAFHAQHSNVDSQHITATSACNTKQRAASSCGQAGVQRQSMQQRLDTLACTMAQSGLGFPARLLIQLDELPPFDTSHPPRHPGDLHSGEVARLQQNSNSSLRPSRRDLLLLMWSTCEFRPEDDRDNRRAELERLMAEADDDDEEEDAPDVTTDAAKLQPPLQPGTDQTTASQSRQQSKAPVNAETVPCFPGRVMSADETIELHEGGEDYGPHGYWHSLKGVSAAGTVEGDEQCWEESDWTGMREVGVTKSGRRANGAEWIGTWREGVSCDQISGEPIAERSAHTWACDGQGAEWEQRWGEQYWSQGRASRFADNWQIRGNIMRHERWAEGFLGKGWVRKHGTSSPGENWDVLEPEHVMYRNPVPILTSTMALDQISQCSAHLSGSYRVATGSRSPQRAIRCTANHRADTPRPPRGRLPQQHARRGPRPAVAEQQHASGGLHKEAEHRASGGALTASQRSPRGRLTSCHDCGARASKGRAAQGSREQQSLPSAVHGSAPAPADTVAAQASKASERAPAQSCTATAQSNIAAGSARGPADTAAAQVSSVQPFVAACSPTDSCCVQGQREHERELGNCAMVASAAVAEDASASIAFGSFGSGSGIVDASDEEPSRPDEPPQEVRASNPSHAAAPSLPIIFGTVGDVLGELLAEVGSTEHLMRLDECDTAITAPGAELPLEDVGQSCISGVAVSPGIASSAARQLLEDATEPSSHVWCHEATLTAPSTSATVAPAAQQPLERVGQRCSTGQAGGSAAATSAARPEDGVKPPSAAHSNEDTPTKPPAAETSLEGAAEHSHSRLPVPVSSAAEQPLVDVSNQQSFAAPLPPVAEQPSIRAPQTPIPTCSDILDEHLPLPVYFCSFLQAVTSEWLQAPLQVAVNAILKFSAAIAALAQTFMC